MNRRLLTTVTSSIVLLLAGGGCASTPSPTNVAAPAPVAAPAVLPGYSVYQNTADGFSLQYPSDWAKTEASGEGQAVVQFLSPMEKNDTFRENLNIIARPTPEGVTVAEATETLDAMVEATLPELKKNFANFKLVADEKEDIPGAPGRSLVYSGKVANAPIPLTFRQTYLLTPKYIFVVTFTATADGYTRFEKAAKTMVTTFRIQ